MYDQHKIYGEQTEQQYGKFPKTSNTYVSEKMLYANSADLDQTAPDQGLHCLPSY